MTEFLLIGILATTLIGAATVSIWDRARNPAFTWHLALRSLAVGGAMVLAGIGFAVSAIWLLLLGTGGAAVDQALVLGLAVFMFAPLEGQRWLPRPERPPWYPSRLFRIAEVGLVIVVLLLVLWGLLAPTHTSFA